MGPDAEHVTSRLSARFWKLIHLASADWRSFVRELANTSEHDRWKLYWTYSAAISVLRAPEYEEHASPDLVEDGLYDLAAWIVAQGRDFYLDVVEHPEHMPSDLPDEPYVEGAPLSEIASAKPEGMGPPEDDEYFLQ